MARFPDNPKIGQAFIGEPGNLYVWNGYQWQLDIGGGGSTGTSGTSGTSGSNGTSGTSGSNGTSGTSGSNGTPGSSGTSGSNGTSGTSGNSTGLEQNFLLMGA
jgi:hypothetical protein